MEEEYSEETSKTDKDSQFLEIARLSYEKSTDFMDANLRNDWEQNIRAFNSEHPKGSKYSSDNYKNRSKVFRPKTRASVRKNEAACAAAFFSTKDMVNIRPEDDRDPVQVASAKVMNKLVNYRLEKTIPWFLTVCGAFQDAQVTGVCASKNYWEYSEKKIGTNFIPELDELGNPQLDSNGDLKGKEEEEIEVITDKPVIELIAPENLRVDPGADWMDPINSSPYVIYCIPMYLHDIKTKMNEVDPKTGMGKWKKYSDAEIQTAADGYMDHDSTRQAREEYREDSKDTSTKTVDEFEIIWVHENFIKQDGIDYHFYSLATKKLLTKPRPLEEVYLHGARPFTMGYTVLEAHKIYPQSKVSLTSEIQKETNDIANQRLDNIKLALNGRMFARQGRNIDLNALVRSTPGGVVLMEDPANDVIVNRPPDVTQSSYIEQDRLNLDFDEIAGNFSTSSVQSNKSLNETVGGMQLISGAASAIGEYDLRIFSETWVEPTMRQLVQLEQAYETDTVVMTLAASDIDLYQTFGTNEVTDEIIKQKLSLNVNVGIGSTNPMEQLQKFTMGAQAVSQLLGPLVAQSLNVKEIITEIFGKLGYKDGMRFFNFGEEDPNIQNMQQQMQQMQQALDDKNAELQAKIQIAQIQAESNIREQEIENQGDLVLEQMKQRGDDNRKKAELTLREAEKMLDSQIKLKQADQQVKMTLINNQNRRA